MTVAGDDLGRQLGTGTDPVRRDDEHPTAAYVSGRRPEAIGLSILSNDQHICMRFVSLVLAAIPLYRKKTSLSLSVALDDLHHMLCAFPSRARNIGGMDNSGRVAVPGPGLGQSIGILAGEEPCPLHPSVGGGIAFHVVVPVLFHGSYQAIVAPSRGSSVVKNWRTCSALKGEPASLMPMPGPLGDSSTIQATCPSKKRG